MNDQIYQRVQNLLESHGSDIGPSECHGMLCGVLCGPATLDRQVWLRHVMGQDETVTLMSADSRGVVDDLVQWTEHSIRSPDFAFELLLPDERIPLPQRADAFAGWCRGFLSGFGLTGIADLSVLGEDAREFLDDLKRFATLTSDSDGEDEERAFEELTEFARMGVLVVQAEVTAAVSKPDDASPTH